MARKNKKESDSEMSENEIENSHKIGNITKDLNLTENKGKVQFVYVDANNIEENEQNLTSNH
jgi:hypothetical protein